MFKVKYAVKKNHTPPVGKYGFVIAQRILTDGKPLDRTGTKATNGFVLSPVSGNLDEAGWDGDTKAKPPKTAFAGRGILFRLPIQTGWGADFKVDLAYLIGVKCKDPSAPPGWLDILYVDYSIQTKGASFGPSKTTVTDKVFLANAKQAGPWLDNL